MLAADLLVRAVTGSALPLNSMDGALFILSEGSPLAGFFGNLIRDIAHSDVSSILSDLRSLPEVAEDPLVMNTLRNSFGITTRQLERLRDLSLLTKLMGVIEQELLTLGAPSFESVSLIGR
jgi:hypothetical protein